MTSLTLDVQTSTGSQVATSVGVTQRSARERFSEIDLLKAIAIIAVVLIHSLRDFPTGPRSATIMVLTDLTRFAVPWFVFAAGFLFTKDATRPSSDILRKAAARILPPYWICSSVWIGLAMYQGQSLTWETLLKMLFYAEANGTYYFVFVITYLYFAGALLRRCSPKAVVGLWILSGLLLVAFYAAWPLLILPDGSWRAAIRSPFIYMFPFLTGWVVSNNYQSLRSRLLSFRPSTVMLIFAVDVLACELMQFVDQSIRIRELLIQVHIYALMIPVLYIAMRYKVQSQAIRFLSESSYGIYLVHIFFVVYIHKFFRMQQAFEVPGRILITCVLSLAFTLIALMVIRSWAGRNARILVGA